MNPKEQIQNNWWIEMDHLGNSHTPFLFIIDFEMLKPVIILPDQFHSAPVRVSIPGFTLHDLPIRGTEMQPLEIQPEHFSAYQTGFDLVMRHLQRGDSYLLNLTMPTAIRSALSLEDLYTRASAPYKLLFKNEFLVFSPEPFIRIQNGIIHAYPMKGTISATIPGAKEKMLSNIKEAAEHATIVDLIRNDLSQVSSDVQVTRYRFVEYIRNLQGGLLQASSEIRGRVDPAYAKKPGSVLRKLLPAGSVSGAPKKRTIEIIRQVEGDSRGYYTGVFGYFDGYNLESAVMIRFIENRDGSFYYRSGGGITAQSNAKDEYEEIIQKIYVPVN